METIEQDAPIRDRFHDFRSGARDRTEQQHTIHGRIVFTGAMVSPSPLLYMQRRRAH